MFALEPPSRIGEEQPDRCAKAKELLSTPSSYFFFFSPLLLMSFIPVQHRRYGSFWYRYGEALHDPRLTWINDSRAFPSSVPCHG